MGGVFALLWWMIRSEVWGLLSGRALGREGDEFPVVGWPGWVRDRVLAGVREHGGRGLAGMGRWGDSWEGTSGPDGMEAEGLACQALAVIPQPWSPLGAAMSVQVATPGGLGLGPERLSPEELVRQTRQVVQGLEALRAEHHGLAGHLAEALAGQGPVAGLELLEEKQQVVSHALEAIELGLGEAQVRGANSGERDSAGGGWVCRGGSQGRGRPSPGAEALVPSGIPGLLCVCVCVWGSLCAQGEP